MNDATSCIRCNTPFPAGAHYCPYCGFPRDLPDLHLTLAGPARRAHVAEPRAGTARRKPSFPLAVLAALFPKALDE